MTYENNVLTVKGREYPVSYYYCTKGLAKWILAPNWVNSKGERMHEITVTSSNMHCVPKHFKELLAKFGKEDFKAILGTLAVVELPNEFKSKVGMYNPTLTPKGKLDINWVLEFNEENLAKELDEIERRFKEAKND